MQVSVPNVSFVFSDICCNCVYLNIVCVSHICCKRFIWILHMFAIVFQVFFMCFSMCFRRMFWMFQLFRTSVAIVSFNVSKVYRSVVHVAMWATLLQLLGCRAWREAAHQAWRAWEARKRGGPACVCSRRGRPAISAATTKKSIYNLFISWNKYKIYLLSLSFLNHVRNISLLFFTDLEK
jgi:hypothetical protein